jgi:pimeloyl-ACP methyl ester carboxylesterase
VPPRAEHPAPPSQYADLDGPVHWVDHGGPADGPLLVCVHGLGGSLLNWAALAPLLVDQARVVAVDLAGFGHTEGGRRSTSVQANQRLLHRFLTEVIDEPVVLVGNSMGGLISAMQTGRHPETVTGLALVDPALPVDLRARPHPLVAAMFSAFAVPAVGRAMLGRRRSSTSAEQSAYDTLRLCCVDPTRVPPEVLDQHVELARHRRELPTDVDGEMIIAARSLMWVLARRRSYDEMLASIRVPVLLLHGEKDRLVPIRAARRVAALNPRWTFAVGRDLGHVPQLEDAPWVAAHLLGWLGQHELLASA